MRPDVDRDFLKELRSARISPKAIPYGTFPYVGGTSTVSDMGYGKGLMPLQPQWFRNYLIPSHKRDEFLKVLEGLLVERGRFACRQFSDQAIPADIDSHFSESDMREEALIWSYYAWTGASSGQPPLKLQERAIELLSQAVLSAESDILPVFDCLSPAFGEFTARFELADSKPQSTGHFNAEVISSYRLRLARLSGWPIFFPAVKPIPERMRLRITGFPQNPKTMPYEILSEAESYLDETLARFPSYAQDPMEELYK
ncbi:hypothetical protein [Ramlibacter sp. WS9]|uniref:hypothetical protein n=1 Tax=Ramlibacter sp. WS9 TaxID=1882741 RepID=UPI001142A12C|nr:hypothetical protein [Ramlibacter sp. WS9]ROZ79733.1 hypothetical protein EEB15_02175 [Ramlibacter sp. WS9]